MSHTKLWMADSQCPHCHGTGKERALGTEGVLLEAQRKARKLSLRALAKMVGLSHTYINEVELGRLPCSDKLAERLAVVYEDAPDGKEHFRTLKLEVLRGETTAKEALGLIGPPNQNNSQLGTWLTARKLQEQEA